MPKEISALPRPELRVSPPISNLEWIFRLSVSGVKLEFRRSEGEDSKRHPPALASLIAMAAPAVVSADILPGSEMFSNTADSPC